MTSNWRSLLFVPASEPALIGKAAAGNADAIVLDLEDGVPPSRKERARASLSEAVEQIACTGKGVIVRVNVAWWQLVQDLDASMLPGLAALMIPKAETFSRLQVIGEMIGELEAERELTDIGLIPLVESAKGFRALHDLAQAPRVMALGLGPEDFALDMGVSPTAELLDMPCRQVALAAAAAGVGAYATPISIGAFRDEGGCSAANARARSYGVHGALCVHPGQVALANADFKPRPEDVDDARAVLAAWRERGTSGIVRVNDRMIDAPIAARAERLLALAEREGA